MDLATATAADTDAAAWSVHTLKGAIRVLKDREHG